MEGEGQALRQQLGPEACWGLTFFGWGFAKRPRQGKATEGSRYGGTFSVAPSSRRAIPPCDSHFAAPLALEWIRPTSAQVAEALIGLFAGSLGRLVSLVAFTADRTAHSWHQRAASLTVLTWLDMVGRAKGGRAGNTALVCDVTCNCCTRTVSALSRPALWKRCRRYVLQHHVVGSAVTSKSLREVCYRSAAAAHGLHAIYCVSRFLFAVDCRFESGAVACVFWRELRPEATQGTEVPV